MKNIFYFLLLLFFTSCDKRECECKSDISYEWENGIAVDSLYISVPNAVLNTADGLNFKLSSLGVSSSYDIDWPNQKAFIFKSEDAPFVNTTDLSAFEDSGRVTFPNELFVLPGGELIEGAVQIKIELTFKGGEKLFINGSVFYYSCDSFQGDFNESDCRWPSQILGDYYEPFPC